MTLIKSKRAFKCCSKKTDAKDGGCGPYDKQKEIDRIDYAIEESEKEMQDGTETVLGETVFEKLEKKYLE